MASPGASSTPPRPSKSNPAASQGFCSQCNHPNPYSNTLCSACGARLPWSDAMQAARQEARLANRRTASMPVMIGCFVLTGLAFLALIILVAFWKVGLLQG